MNEFIDRLVRCADQMCKRDERLRPLVDAFCPWLHLPAVHTHVVDVSMFPVAMERRFERDRPYILNRIERETGCDVSEELSYPVYVAARARGRYLCTKPAFGVCRKHINIIPAPSEEVLIHAEWAIGLTVCGDLEPMKEATWVARVVREPMNDLWTGFAMIELFMFIHTLIASDELTAPEGYTPIADAFRARENRGSQVCLKVAHSEMRRTLFRNMFPESPLCAIPYGMVIDADAITAYKDLVVESLSRSIGPPTHRLESEHRETFAYEVTIAQCVGMHLLPHTINNLLD